MATASRPGSRFASVRCEAGKLVARLTDGREVRVPLDWYPRLAKATLEQQSRWRLVGRGYGVHWPEVDEDISIEMLLDGRASGTTEPA